MRHLIVVLVLMISASTALANGSGNSAPAEWWDEQAAGWLGGSVGLLGAAFGIAAGFGIARRAVLAAAFVGALVGLALLFVGIAAFLSGQPYHVYYLPQLIGGVMAFVFGINYPIIKRRNEQIELQRIAALDS